MKIKLKEGVVPRFFECQTRRKGAQASSSRSAFLKRQRQEIIEECIDQKKVKINLDAIEIAEEIADVPEEEKLAKNNNTMDFKSIGVQANIRPSLKSKLIQCSLLRPPKIVKDKHFKSPEIVEPSSSSSVCDSSGSSSEFIIDACSETELQVSQSESLEPYNMKQNVEKRQVYVIEKNPKRYLGIPENSLLLIDIILAECPLTKIDIFITLKKIKLNQSYACIGDDFGVSSRVVGLIFQKSLPILCRVFKNFIQWKPLAEIKKHLPIPFRHRYNKVQCIIDCFEVSIQKPTNPVLQALTWSEYKKCNTFKYLVGCAPDGLINYISKGFGGRTSDITIVNESGFLDLPESGADIMADRGFKHIDEVLASKNVVLVRPPSVSSKTKNTKTEVKEAKRIASLRIHIERVISRIREFEILAPHACVHNKLVAHLDNISIIVCGIINIQNFLIK